MRPTLVQYDAPGWGVGEVWLDEQGVVFYSELPRPKRTSPATVPGHVPKRTSPGTVPSHVLSRRLAAFFAGAVDDFRDVALRADEGFYGECARVLRGVARGQVITYGELAELAGRPRAARAAGTFCARCELAPFLPVHRVVASDGLGSWGSLGVEYKRRMLELDGVVI